MHDPPREAFTTPIVIERKQQPAARPPCLHSPSPGPAISHQLFTIRSCALAAKVIRAADNRHVLLFRGAGVFKDGLGGMGWVRMGWGRGNWLDQPESPMERVEFC